MIIGEMWSNLWIALTGPVEELDKAKELLTIIDGAAKYSRVYVKGKWDGKRRLYVVRDKGSTLLIWNGLAEWLGRKLHVEGIDFAVEGSILEAKYYKKDWWKLPIEMRSYQKASVQVALDKQFGLLQMATNAGKTLVLAGIINAYRESPYRVLVLVHRLELLKQTVEYFRDMLKCMVGVLAAGQDFTQEKIVVGMVSTVYARMGTRKDVAEYLSKVDVLLVDEAHHASASSYRKIMDMMEACRVRIGVSGSFPPEESIPGLMLKGYFGEVLYKVSNAELATLKISAPIEVSVIRGNWVVLGLDEELKAVFAKRTFNPTTKYWTLAYERAIVKNTARNVVIGNVIRKRICEGGVLVIVDRLEHGGLLFDEVKDLNVRLVFANAEDRKEDFEAFKAGHAACLISSPILEEGISVDGIKTLVLAAGGKSKRKLLQRIGRGLRKKKDGAMLQVYDLYDAQVKLLERHTLERIKLYEDEGFPVKYGTLEEVIS